MNSKTLWNQRTNLVDTMNEAVKAEDMDEARRLEGEIRALDRVISDVVTEEDNARTAQATNVLNARNATLGEKLFGAKAQFKGIEKGFEAKVSVKDAVSGLSTPQIYRTDLNAPVAPPTGFLGTLPKGTTNGDEHFFTTPVLTNNAAGWVSGNKPESALKWTEATALLETIAHYIPIKKQTANRYSDLESIVASSLMLGLDLKCDEYALNGDNESGIIGVTETDGILTHTKAEGKNIYDTVQTMKRKVRVASGMVPNYVCMSPYAIEALSQTKDEEGRYLFENFGNGSTLLGMTVVEDVNMTADDGKETALVYYAGGASWDIADPEEVTIGLTNSQFIQNEYTLLAETTAALRVHTPAAFCYCGDLGLAAESIDSE